MQHPRNTQINRVSLVALSLGSLVALLSCAKAPSAQTEFIMGTVCTVNLYDKGTAAAYEAIFARLKELDGILSANTETSNVAEINANSGIKPIKAKPEVAYLLQESLSYCEKTKGLFDPSIGALVKVWNIGFDNATVPAASDLRRALGLIDYGKIAFDRQNDTVFLSEPGMRLDFGAIAKGYAADEAARICAERGIHSAMIDLGGNIYALGKKRGKTAWTIGIRDPENQQVDPIITFPVEDKSIVTSGVYERYFESDGKRYHHILDPRTGFPADNGILSVTIIAKSSTKADALSTSTFLLGIDEGMKLANEENVDAVFITNDHRIIASEGIKPLLAILKTEYSLAP